MQNPFVVVMDLFHFLSLFTGLLMLSTQLVFNYHILKSKQTDGASQCGVAWRSELSLNVSKIVLR